MEGGKLLFYIVCSAALVWVVRHLIVNVFKIEGFK